MSERGSQTTARQRIIRWLQEEREIPDWSALWGLITDLQRAGYIHVRWQDTGKSLRAFAVLTEKGRNEVLS